MHKMRGISARLLRMSAALLCLALAGCFDIREEVWIRGDGSGRAELRYTVPETAALLAGGPQGLERHIRELIESQPPLKLEKIEVTRDRGEIRIAVDISTDSMLSLLDLKQNESMSELPSSAGDLMGNFDVRIHGLDIDLTRTVRAKEALGLTALGISREQREIRRLSYIIHLPKPPKESNAPRTEDGGRTLIWDHSLDEAMQGPLTVRFRARMPLPRWVVPAFCAAAFAIVFASLRLWQRLLRGPR